MKVGSVVFIAAVLLAVPAMGDQVIYSQAIAHSGGFSADTDFTTESGIHDYWQRVADDVQVTEDAQVSRVSWYGFYYLNGLAPADETMRVRFYGSRGSDGLPDEAAILYEQTVENPTRQATGFRMPVSIGPKEYKYSVTLTSPVSLLADTTYWLEIAQIGGPDYDFFWETAFRTPFDGMASSNPNFPNWHAVAPPNELAFDLSTPEPTSGLIVLLTAASSVLNRRQKRYIANNKIDARVGREAAN